MIRRAPGASDTHAYNISARKPTPINANLTIGSKSAAAKKRARRKVELQNTETDLIQDFSFPTVSHRIKVSRDGRYIFASGTYPPQIHVYDTHELSLKFKRHVTNDIVDFQILEEDWRKFALLTADRYVDIHSQFGSHFRTRVPRHGRDLMLHQGTCDLFVCGEGAEVWRLNLEQGRFMAPFSTLSGVNGGNNVCGMNPMNSLLAFGGETALLDIWDPRVASKTKKPAATLDVGQVLTDSSANHSRGSTEISSLRFDESDGVSLAVGTSTGISLLFDLRSSKPVQVRDHGNGLPIRSLRLHVDGKHCISADPKSVKVWNKISGANMIAIEPDADINHLCVVGGSGVMCAAVETQRVRTYYVPALGSAPKWCAFLDNFTEELELGKQIMGVDGTREGDRDEEEVYENYKFVPHDELEGLGLGHLIGTDMLKAYMHGYFVHQKLYRRAIEVAEPFAYEKYRREKAKEKLDAERQSRISKVKKNGKRKVSVNQKMLEILSQKTKGSKKGTDSAVSVADDERFSAMFSNKDYAVDEEAERYQYLYPAGTGNKRKTDSDDNSDEEYLEQFELVDEGGNAEAARNDEGESDYLSSEDEEDGSESVVSGDESPPHRNAEYRAAPNVQKSRRAKENAPKMYKVGELAELVRTHDHLQPRQPKANGNHKLRENIPLGSRISSKKSSGDVEPESLERDRRKRSRGLRR